MSDYSKLIISLSQNAENYAVSMRQYFHVHAEPTSREFATVKRICSELDTMGIKYVNIPDGGVLAAVEGDGSSDAHILLRADCDALGMTEDPDNGNGQKKAYVSQNSCAAHMCGHDAHTAMLLGAAKCLKEMDPSLIRGTVYLLFERGEEGGNCIYYVMKYIQEHKIRIDSCFAIHVDPSLPVGTFWAKSGPSNAGNVNFEIVLTGKGGHGSRPDLSNNPIDCFVAIVNDLKDVRYKYISPTDLITYNIGAVNCGTRRNIIPENLEFKGTSRFYNSEAGLIFKNKLRAIVEKNCEIYDVRPSFNVFSGPSFSVINNSEAAQIARDALTSMYGQECLRELPLSMGSESFSTLSNYYPSVMIRLGVGNKQKGMTAALHNPHFDLDESALKYGISAHLGYVTEYMKEPRRFSFTPFKGDADDVLKFTNRPVPKRFDADM
ncbi:MAG: M20 family metallopeptidase [Pyramidobacter sp.]